MKKENFQIISQTDQLLLDVLTAEPEGEPLGVVQICHGMCEYKERYLPFMEYLAEQGYASLIHDHRGHGASVCREEDLGYFYSGGAEALVEDAHQLTRCIRARWPGKPVILLGHSMGSLVVRSYVKCYDGDVNMLVVVGSPSKNPAVDLGICLAKLQKRFRGERSRGRLLEKLAFGSFDRKFPGEGKSAWICSDPRVQEAYRESPLCGFIFTVDAYLGLFELMKSVYSKKGWLCSNPDLPVLFLGGAEDPCIGGPARYARAVKRMRRAGYRNVRAKLYSGMRHEILNERGKKTVYEDLLRYIQLQEKKHHFT